MRQKRRYTVEQIEYIRSIAKGKTRQEITDLFNEKYNEKRTLRSIGAVMSRNGIYNRMQGYATRFKKGQKAWNKGKKGLNLGGEAGWFKKGQITPMQKPVGSMSTRSDPRLNKDWIIIKVAEPNEWQLYHHYLWEKHNGKIPENHVVLFKNNDHKDVHIENLMLVDKRVMTSVAKRNLRSDHAKLNETIHKVAELDLLINKKESEV